MGQDGLSYFASALTGLAYPFRLKELRVEQRIHQIGLFGCIALVATGLISLATPRRENRLAEANKAQQFKEVRTSVLRLSETWDIRDLSHSGLPLEPPTLASLSRRLPRLAKELGPLKKVMSFELLDDGSQPIQVSSRMTEVGTKVRGPIVAQLRGSFDKADATLIFGVRRSKFGLQIVSISHPPFQMKVSVS